jgi:hypothetical protein
VAVADDVLLVVPAADSELDNERTTRGGDADGDAAPLPILVLFPVGVTGAIGVVGVDEPSFLLLTDSSNCLLSSTVTITSSS